MAAAAETQHVLPPVLARTQSSLQPLSSMSAQSDSSGSSASPSDDALSSSESSSSSTGSTVRAASPSAERSSPGSDCSPDSPTVERQPWENLQQQARHTTDIRSRSASAPSSRSASFIGNLDQLAFLSQSAHRFPAVVPSPKPLNASHTSRSDLRTSDDLSPLSPLLAPQASAANTPSPASSPRLSLGSSQSTPTSPQLRALHRPSDISASARTPVQAPIARRAANANDAGPEAAPSYFRSNGVPARPRSALFSPGSGFTPAVAHVPHAGRNSPTQHARPFARSQDSSSRDGLTIQDLDQQRQAHGSHSESNGRSSRAGRLRSTSASHAIGMSSITSHSRNASSPVIPSQTPRQGAHSAQTSPVFSPLQSLTPAVEGASARRASARGPRIEQQPQRTRSVPHLPQVSPISYGIGISHVPGVYSAHVSPQLGAVWDGYFMLPPELASTQRNTAATNMTDESPPPYTPSEVNMPSLAGFARSPSSLQAAPDSATGHSSTRQRRRNPRATEPIQSDDDEEDNDTGLSFSARRRERNTTPTSALQRSASSPDSVVAPAVRSDTEAETEFECASPEVRSSNGGSAMSGRHMQCMGTEEWSYIERLERPSRLRQFVLTYLLHPLRLLAAIPGSVGTFWLTRNAVKIYFAEGTLMQRQPDGRLAAFAQMQRAPQPSGLEFALAALWSLATAYHALSFTTLLLRRWLHYYSLLPSLIRLVALQAICWPLVRVTLHILGALNPLPAWVVVSSTTAFSDTVARWVVSNITDESTTPVDIVSIPQSRDRATPTSFSTRNSRKTGHRRRGQARAVIMAFWRSIMGAPPRQRGDLLRASIAAGERGFMTESEAELESEVDAARHRLSSNSRLAAGRSGTVPSSLFSRGVSATSPSSLDGLRRRAPALESDYVSEFTSGGEGDGDESYYSRSSSRRSGRGHLAQYPRIERVGRIFHWDVAVKRNLLPLCILAYLTMWALFIEDIRLRW